MLHSHRDWAPHSSAPDSWEADSRRGWGWGWQWVRWGPAGMKNPPPALTHKQMVSKHGSCLTVPVIVVLLVAVTVQVQVRAAGEVETGTRQEVRLSCSFRTVSLLLHCVNGCMARRLHVRPTWRLAHHPARKCHCFPFSSFIGGKIQSESLVLQHGWTSERKK